MQSLTANMLIGKSIKELSQGFKNKEFSSVDLLKECLSNIKKFEAKINSSITLVDEEAVLQIARQADEKKEKSFLTGIPFVLKDAYVTKGIRTTAASNILKNYIPQYDATVYQKLNK